ncbi:MAG: O-antigen ligase family protein, partial [Actinomycetota bacterium]|nr:O-antigen ligase family protein [Actinomycetota bacterium]
SAASQRDALQDGVTTATSIHEGTELIWLAVIVCGGVALLQVALGLAARHLERPALLAPGRRTTVLRSVALLAVVCVAGVAAGAPGWVDDRWQEFKAPVGTVKADNQDNVFSRLQGVNGKGRYQNWQSALDANATHPWEGIGPGTFEFWWARNGTTPAFFRDAHTLYFETLAETGIVGFVLLIGLLLFLAGTAVARSLRGPPGVRIWLAAAVGGLAAFMTAAAYEWVWEMGAIACAAMVLGAVILAGRDDTAVADDRKEPSRPLLPRVAIALLAVVAIGAVAVPMAGALATRDSRSAAADGRLLAALEDSRTAERLQPYAATPHLQRALVLEESGALLSAAAAAKAATADEPTNWRTWFVLARIDARRGEQAAAVQALRRAKRLNPRSPLLGTR